MDQLLALARSRPDSPEFREALVKQPGRSPDQERRSLQLQRPRFRLGGRSPPRQPRWSSTISRPGAMRRIAGSDLWFYVGAASRGNRRIASTT